MYCRTPRYLMVKWFEYMWLFIKFDLAVICTVFMLRHFGTSIPIISVFRFLTNKHFTQDVSLAEAAGLVGSLCAPFRGGAA